MTNSSLNESKSSTQFLDRRIGKLSQIISKTKTKLNKLSIIRLISFSIFISLSALYYFSRTDNRLYLLPIFISFLVFVGLVLYFRKIELFKFRLLSYENLLKRETLRSEFKLDTFYDYDIAINKFGLYQKKQ